MRLAFVGPFALSPKSTVAVRVLPLARAMAGRGHEVTVVIPPWDNPDYSGRCWEDRGVQVVNLTLPRSRHPASYPLLALRLLNHTTRLRPDIVHVFKPKGFSGAVAQALLARRWVTGSGPGVVVDTDDWEGAGGWNDRAGYPWWQRRVFVYQEQALLQHADAVTAASRTLLQMTAALRGSAETITYLPNGPGIRGGEFVVGASAPGAGGAAGDVAQALQPVRGGGGARLRQSLGIPDGPVVLLYTRFVESPPERTAAMLAAIRANGRPPAVLLVGTGLNGEETVFLRAAETAGLPAVHAGWVEPARLWDYFALAGVAVFPMEDTLLNRAKCSVKLVDLLHAGFPVVAEAVGQCLEYIVDGTSGLLTPPGDFGAFARAVERVLGDAPLQQRLSDGARERTSKAFAWQRLAGRLEDAYARVLAPEM